MFFSKNKLSSEPSLNFYRIDEGNYYPLLNDLMDQITEFEFKLCTVNNHILKLESDLEFNFCTIRDLFH